MNETRTRIIQWTALLACGFIATQIATILFKGEAFCLNQGCEIIESLSTVPPIYFNLAGLLYFLAIFLVNRCSKCRDESGFDRLKLLLLTGLAAEGVLVSYQLFIAQTFCSYCLIIFAIIVLLNIIYGWRQLLLGAAVFLTMLIAFSSLNFGSSQIFIQSQNLETGTFAVKSNAAPSKQLFLFFSSDCPHCQNVLDTLEGDNNCEINFNPIDQIDSLDLLGLTYSVGYNPSLNRLILSLLDIKTIPVLLAKNQHGMNFVKGEGAIVDFIKEACFEPQIDLYSGSTSYDAPLSFSSDTAQEGECEIEVECLDPEEQSTSSAY